MDDLVSVRVGDRIELTSDVRRADSEAPARRGLRGTVSFIDRSATIHVRLDNGLAIDLGVNDRFLVLKGAVPSPA